MPGTLGPTVEVVLSVTAAGQEVVLEVRVSEVPALLLPHPLAAVLLLQELPAPVEAACP